MNFDYSKRETIQGKNFDGRRRFESTTQQCLISNYKIESLSRKK